MYVTIKRLLTYLSTYLLVHSLTHLFTHILTHSHIHSHSYSLTYLFTHSLKGAIKSSYQMTGIHTLQCLFAALELSVEVSHFVVKGYNSVLFSENYTNQNNLFHATWYPLLQGGQWHHEMRSLTDTSTHCCQLGSNLRSSDLSS